jgi:multisubunit Na+/H+ antiporter MnhC subunit
MSRPFPVGGVVAAFLVVCVFAMFLPRNVLKTKPGMILRGAGSSLVIQGSGITIWSLNP